MYLEKMNVCSVSRAAMSNYLQPRGQQTTRLPLSMEFSRQKYWSELPFPTLGDLPNLGIEPRSPALQADALPLCHLGSPVRTIRLALNITPKMLFKQLVYNFLT